MPGAADLANREITQVYAVLPEKYAIYKAGAVKVHDVDAHAAKALTVKARAVNAGDVMVQFADDIATAQEQRNKLVQIGAARAEINVLLEGLEGLGCRDIGDRQLVSALQFALEGRPDDAKATLADEKARILAKLAARGRFHYLKWSYGAAALLMGLLFILSWLFPFPIDHPSSSSSDVWLAAKAGLVGAAFSISQAIHGRNVAFGTDKLDNITDGVLRLVIGIISAGVLLLLFASQIIPSMKLGNADLTGGALDWQKVLIIGFVGGFLERVIPDLLKKQDATGQHPRWGRREDGIKRGVASGEVSATPHYLWPGAQDQPVSRGPFNCPTISSDEANRFAARPSLRRSRIGDTGCWALLFGAR